MPVPRRRTVFTLLAGLLCAVLTGCAPGATLGRGASPATTAPSATGSAVPGPDAGTAPATSFAVGVRTLDLSRGADRPLRTVLWYPAAGTAGNGTHRDAAVAAGRFPVLLFSHGLGGQPEGYAAGTARLAAAGFVVAAPAYPHTNSTAHPVNPVDVVNQPADASAVLNAVLALERGGDPLAGHLRTDRVAALGHSAGGYTTAALFGVDRDPRLVAGVVISGGTIGSFRGASAPLLFVHGDADQVVNYRAGRSAYDSLTWPKAFLTESGGGHVDFLSPANKGFAPMITTITDFLRWALYGDAAAKARLGSDAGVAGVTRWESRL